MAQIRYKSLPRQEQVMDILQSRRRYRAAMWAAIAVATGFAIMGSGG